MNLNRLLVALDGSEEAESALPYAEAIVKVTDGELYLVAVADITSFGSFSAGSTSLANLATKQDEQLLAYLKQTAKALRGRGVPSGTVLRHGDPADQILMAADDLHASAIAMATHGRSGLARSLIGSVADAVIRTSTRPVFAVRPLPGDHGRQSVVSLRRLMVPLDGSLLGEAALPLAVDLARLAGAVLVLVRVEPHLLHLHAGYEFIPDFEYPSARTIAAARDYLARTGEAFASGVPLETVVSSGSPAAELYRLANENAVDLTLMATHGCGGFHRLVIGSTADRLVRYGLPLLLVPPAMTEETRSPAAEPEAEYRQDPRARSGHPRPIEGFR